MVIKGTPDAQWKAQFDIFDKIRKEHLFKDRELLRSEIRVPKSLVGRIIGRGGVRVRDVDRCYKLTDFNSNFCKFKFLPCFGIPVIFYFHILISIA